MSMRVAMALLLALILGCSQPVDESEATGGPDVPGFETAGDDALPDASPSTPWRFAVISDTHVTASDTHPDNLLFAATGAHLAGLTPAVDLVVSTGDNVDDLYMFQEMFSLEDPVPVLELYRGLIDQHYPMPFYVSLGIHDVRLFDTWRDATGPAAAWVDAFAGTESLPSTYFAVEQDGFQLLILNSTGGATDYETNDAGTFEPEQLEWLDARLSHGAPAILFLHHELIPEGSEDLSHPLFPLLAAHAGTVRAVFGGHVHHFDHVTWRGIDFYTTGELKGHAGPVYHLVECDPADGSVTVVETVDSP